MRVLDRLPEPERPDAPCWGDPDRSYNLGLGGREAGREASREVERG